MNLALPLLCSLCLLSWGVATDRFAWAVCMSAVFFAASLHPTKIELTPKGRQRLNEASFLLVVAGALWFWLIRQTLPTALGLHYVSLAPVFLYPRLLARALCSWDPSAPSFNPSDGVAWARAWAAQARLSPPRLDLRQPLDFQIAYLLLCAFSCSVFLPGLWPLAVSALALISVCTLKAAELSSAHGRRWQRGALIAAGSLCLAALIGFGGGFFINHAIQAADAHMNSWWSRKADSSWSSLMTRTSIGKTGMAEMSTRLLYRLEWSEGSGYLRRGVYPVTQDGTTWQIGGGASMAEKPLFPGAEGTFTLRPSSSSSGPQKQALISATLSRERSVLPLPMGATEIFALPVGKLNLNSMGSVNVVGATGFAKFGALFNPDNDALPPPEAMDTKVPDELIPALDAFIFEAGLTGLPAEAAAQKIKSHFAKHWSYTLNLASSTGGPRSLSAFLRSERAGHCEYFASAGALIMRRMGYPTRYATGFLVSEYDAQEQNYWIRARDSHAWLHYWDGSRWALLDPTVSASEEDGGLLDGLSDYFSRLQYRIDQFDSAALLSGVHASSAYPLLALALGFLAFKIIRAKKTRHQRKSPTPSERLVAAVELHCQTKRHPGESSSVFWRRAAPLTPIEPALLLAAQERENALFAPPTPQGAQDERAIKEALRLLAKANKTRRPPNAAPNAR